jgi:hypothetical protein
MREIHGYAKTVDELLKRCVVLLESRMKRRKLNHCKGDR